MVHTDRAANCPRCARSDAGCAVRAAPSGARVDWGVGGAGGRLQRKRVEGRKDERVLPDVGGAYLVSRRRSRGPGMLKNGFGSRNPCLPCFSIAFLKRKPCIPMVCAECAEEFRIFPEEKVRVYEFSAGQSKVPWMFVGLSNAHGSVLNMSCAHVAEPPFACFGAP